MKRRESSQMRRENKSLRSIDKCRGTIHFDWITGETRWPLPETCYSLFNI